MDRHIEVIYCDDVRMEQRGKLSFMGVYQADMFVSRFPIVLSKFCIQVSAVTPISNPFQKLTYRILKDDDILTELTVPEDDLKTAAQNAGDDEERIAIVRVGLNFVPLKFDAPCKLRIRVDTETEELKGSSLKIGLQPD